MKKGFCIYGGAEMGSYTVVLDGEVWEMCWTKDGHRFLHLGEYGLEIGRHAALKANKTWGKKMALIECSLIVRQSLAVFLAWHMAEPELFLRAGSHHDFRVSMGQVIGKENFNAMCAARLSQGER